MRRYNRTSLKVWGLKAKTYASVIILVELMLIISIVGFAYKQNIKVAQAEGVYSTIYEQRHTYIEKPTTQQQQIIDYIKVVFGKDADNAFKILSCENHNLRTDAQNYNSDGSVDIGIFQINSVHGVNPTYLYDWRTNVSIGYHIFKDSGWGAWTCARRFGL